MVAKARRRLLGRNRKAVFHCTARCVRRAFLCGRDRLTGRDYSHRRGWILQREEQLAGLFALEVEFRAERSNHLHVVLRTRPEIARRWSAREVARRWLTATRLAKRMTDGLPSPDPKKLEALVKNKKKIARLRRRLSSVSWFMGFLCENIARRANVEDEATGRFWEGRFRCRECTDENAILMCGVYVDLNASRDGDMSSPETAPHTSVYDRWRARSQPAHARDRADGWMAELTLRPERKAEVELAYRSRTGRRASDLGVLPIRLEEYVKLLKWTARQLNSGARSTIPRDLEAILDHMEMKPEAWLETVANYESVFCHAVGPPASLANVARRMEVGHLKGASASRRAFA
jgi:hypothetical protein